MRGKKKSGTKTKRTIAKNKKARKIGTTKKAAMKRGAAGRASSLKIPGDLRANLMARAGDGNWKDFAIENLSRI